MKKNYYSAIVCTICTIGLTLTIACAVFTDGNLDTEVHSCQEFRVPDPVQLQIYLNDRMDKDPAPPEFEKLKIDGNIGRKTILVWEYYSAVDVKLFN